jgi:hypothetical protein
MHPDLSHIPLIYTGILEIYYRPTVSQYMLLVRLIRIFVSKAKKNINWDKNDDAALRPV